MDVTTKSFAHENLFPLPKPGPDAPCRYGLGRYAATGMPWSHDLRYARGYAVGYLFRSANGQDY